MLHLKLSIMRCMVLIALMPFANIVLGNKAEVNWNKKILNDQLTTGSKAKPEGTFFAGGRYGRSLDTRPLFASPKIRRLNLQPRNDGFFIGSRYGKRTQAIEINDEASESIMNRENQLSCIYTGVTNIYRCYKSKYINPILKQLTDGPNNEYNKK